MKHFRWCIPRYTPDVIQQEYSNEQILTKLLTELRYTKGSVCLNKVKGILIFVHVKE